MPVLLRTRHDVPSPDLYDAWAVIGAAELVLEPGRRVPGLAAALEQAFVAIADDWISLGRKLAEDRSAELAHAPACAANISDLGQMMAWSYLVMEWAAASSATLVICEDPWLFRHLAGKPGVQAGPPPSLFGPALRLWFRGYAARAAGAVRCAAAALRSRTERTRGQSYILVYGHPRSTVDGIDGYFGDLMRWMPALRRVLHVDCGVTLARQLSADGRTVSLHGFGSALAAGLLPLAKWRPSRAQTRGAFGWLVRRAAAREGGTGQGAAIRWQIHCQERFLRAARPRVVAWPWENHSWERRFVRQARAAGVRTVGYQHSVVGRLMLNYTPRSATELDAILPDRIACNGEATRRRLIRFGIPEARLVIGGALRYLGERKCWHDADGPVFVAFPFDGVIAQQMAEACRAAAHRGWKFLLKSHPMTPYEFSPGQGLTKCLKPLVEIGGVRAVLYAATAVGQEAILAGIPTFRFLPRDRVAIDVMPDGVDAEPVTEDTLATELSRPVKPPAISAESLFAPVDRTMWKDALG